jgi:hypothetical protein
MKGVKLRLGSDPFSKTGAPMTNGNGRADPVQKDTGRSERHMPKPVSILVTEDEIEARETPSWNGIKYSLYLFLVIAVVGWMWFVFDSIASSKGPLIATVCIGVIIVFVWLWWQNLPHPDRTSKPRE